MNPRVKATTVAGWAVAVTTIIGWVAAPLAQTADAIYSGGDIVTVNDAQPSAEALAVKDGKILFVGSKVDAEKRKGGATKVVDLGGKTLMPSFLDAHSHYINSLLVANQCKLYAPPAGPGKDVESIIAALEQFAQERKIPKGEMIMGYGYDDTVMPNGRLLNRDDLDGHFPTTRSGSITCRCTAR